MLRVIVILIIALFMGSCKKDPCEKVTCDHGTCTDGSCLCETGYEGSNCETEQRLAFVGDYAVSETCGTDNYNYTISVTANSENASELTINNIGNFNFHVTATVNGFAIAITNQSGNGKTVNGSGEFNETGLTLSYIMETTSGQTISCSLVGSLE